MDQLSILWVILIGLIAGAIAGWILRGKGFGFILNMIVGLIGSLIGDWIYNLLGFQTITVFGEVLMSVMGAIILLGIVSLFQGE